MGENVADYASPGVYLDQSNEGATQTWLKGPEFLWKPEREWPKRPDIFGDVPSDDKKVKTAQIWLCFCQISASQTVENKLEEVMNRYSQLYKLQKTIAWIQCFKSLLRNRAEVRTGPLTVDEITQATNEIVEIVQRKVFPRDFAKEVFTVAVTTLSVPP
ncbi:uncharacterized protein LOC106163638 [Lingula anatina]|uniref:Uncharacterized protein LOC106163638 n=1 Tax=Lingula anatina TaxID=7574 RepID=A0A1S3IF24_LINAN|nr:uncharacterized protein LOC106163638 [Lingula anatina]|eukprot:XP_013396743.1 uncharacterized protein LOC106163638 [Lingula anatina]